VYNGRADALELGLQLISGYRWSEELEKVLNFLFHRFGKGCPVVRVVAQLGPPVEQLE
jgi:hypothetical protein